MTSTAATFIDYNAASPSSEQSTHFDTPTMIWAKQSSDGLPRSETPVRSDHDLPGAFVTYPYNAAPQAPEEGGSADVQRKPSLGIVQDPAPREDPSKGNEQAEVTREGSSSHRRSNSIAAKSDSGYGSTAQTNGVAKETTPRPQSRGSDGDVSMMPIPILWTDSPHQRGYSLVDEGAQIPKDSDRDKGKNQSIKESPFKRGNSLHSFRTSTADRERERDERRSVMTAPSLVGAGSGLRRRRTSLVGGSFASGPGMVGPAASPAFDDAFHARSQSAELGLSERQKVKLTKAQIKEGKKVAKIIMAEGKAEEKALGDAVKELADLQKLQKLAIRDEGKAYTAYSKALRDFHKVELEFLEARARYDRAQADLQAHEDARDASRAHSRDTTEMIQEKNREVEWLRAQKAVDDREREAKVRQLTGK